MSDAGGLFMSNFQDVRRDVCWLCGGRLVWGNDYSPEDLGYDEGTDGIVSHLTCMGCGAFVEYRRVVGEQVHAP